MPKAKSLEALVASIDPQLLRALKEVLGADAPAKGKSGTAKGERTVLPTLTCWNLSSDRVTDNGDGTLTYTKRDGTVTRYRILSEADAIKVVRASIKAGRVYAIRA